MRATLRSSTSFSTVFEGEKKEIPISIFARARRLADEIIITRGGGGGAGDRRLRRRVK